MTAALTSCRPGSATPALIGQAATCIRHGFGFRTVSSAAEEGGATSPRPPICRSTFACQSVKSTLTTCSSCTATPRAAMASASAGSQGLVAGRPCSGLPPGAAT